MRKHTTNLTASF